MEKIPAEAVDLKVRAILATIDGFSHVIIDRDTFEKVNGYDPKVEWDRKNTTRDADGGGVRFFNLNGGTLYTKRVKDEDGRGRTLFFMREEEARKCLSTLAEEREGEDILPLSPAAFLDVEVEETA